MSAEAHYNRSLPQRKMSRQFTDEEKIIFRLGVYEGEARVKYRLSLARRANKCLWDELEALDVVDPLVHVKLSLAEVEELIGLLSLSLYTGSKTGFRRRCKDWQRRLTAKLAQAREIRIESIENED